MNAALVEIDWQLAENLAWALRVEELARSRGVPLEALADFACVRLLHQLRAADWS